jgi:hypothetical protein
LNIFLEAVAHVSLFLCIFDRSLNGLVIAARVRKAERGIPASNSASHCPKQLGHDDDFVKADEKGKDLSKPRSPELAHCTYLNNTVKIIWLSTSIEVRKSAILQY